MKIQNKKRQLINSVINEGDKKDGKSKKTKVKFDIDHLLYIWVAAE